MVSFVSSPSFLPLAALFALAHSHSVILSVQGIVGSPASIGFAVDASIARNCTAISPCQQDTDIIRDVEISQGIAGICGRTELNGTIDVSGSIEAAISAKEVTTVQAGTTLTVTMHQVNQDGAGPYVCELYETNSTTSSATLTVTNDVPGANGLSQAKFEDFNMTVQMPSTFTCQEGSTGKICTVRCRNNALAGPFGGCFAVQQV